MPRARYRLTAPLLAFMVLASCAAMYQIAIVFHGASRALDEYSDKAITIPGCHELEYQAYEPLPDYGFSNNEFTSLDTRQVPWNTDYKKATEKGKQFLCWMADPTGAGSKAIPKFTDFADLDKFGWSKKESTADYCHVTEKECDSLSQVLGTDLGDGVKVQWDHDKDSGVYPATNGEYVNVYWPNHGIIMANDNYGPQYQVDKGKGSKNPWKDASGKSYPIVPLRQWSDINFLTYTHLSSSPLRYIFRRNIQNQKTKDIIDKAHKKAKFGDKALPWPGKRFMQGVEGFEALVSTPNASGICWLLIQHQGVLGKKTIKSITVWWDGKGPYTPNMMVEVGDVET